MTRRGLTLWEVLIVIVLIALFAAILLPAIARADGALRRGSDAVQIKQLGLACRMYARESKDNLYPSIDVRPTLPLDVLHPAYLDSDAVAALSDMHSVYTGWALDRFTAEDPQESLCILGGDPRLTAAAQLVRGVGPVLDTMRRTGDVSLADTDIPVPGGLGTAGGITIHRLREGIERFAVTDINNVGPGSRAESRVWLLGGLAQASDTRPGAHVLFLDGHVEFVRAPESAALTSDMLRFSALFD